MRTSATVKWVALALVGLAIASGVAIAASRLASERIGIASESVSAGRELAPAIDRAAATGERRRNGTARGDGREASDEPRGGAATEAPAGTTSSPSAPDGSTGSDALDERLDAAEDRRKEAEDAAEDRRKETEDLRDEQADAAEDRRKEAEDARDD